MRRAPTPDPLEDPQYFRGESHRLQKIIRVLSDSEVKKELAAHSLYLAQRAEAIKSRRRRSGNDTDEYRALSLDASIGNR